MLIKANQLVLFQGDSITDCGRLREQPGDLGRGYAMIAAARLAAGHPELRVRFLNRGISGNRAIDLVERWKADCIDLKPDWVSILIGINDAWRWMDSGEKTPVERFEASYRRILEATRKELGARLVICEPFLLPVPKDLVRWREDLDPKIQVCRKLAREFGAVYVPFDGLFAAATSRREAEFWASDGVHPSEAGHALMAQAWLEEVGAG